MRRYLASLALIGSVLFTTFVSASDYPFRVKDIRIEGLQRVSAGTVFSALPINVGDSLEPADISDATRKLFKSAYFQDITMGRDGDVLVVTVVERPSISSIEIDGNKSIETDNLMDGLSSAGLAQGQVFQRATLDSVHRELERQYVAQGRYGAKIDTEVVPQPRNRVSLNIEIDEGSVASIAHINIVGNKLFSDEHLRKLFELTTPNWLSFYTQDDKYSRQKLSGDLERLRSWYLDRGYINFNIESTQVSITPDKSDVYITVNVIEGEQFTVKDVKLAGDLIVPEEQLKLLLLVKEGQTFSRQYMTFTEDLITKRLGNEGYTFANVSGIPEQNEDGKTLNVTFFVDPGKRAYVRRINFRGNTKTVDEVLRREMRQMEGGWASTDLIDASKTRLERLGFFKEVSVDTPAVPGTNDQIDVNYTVEEQPSGNVSASLGFSQGSGIVLGASVSQENFLGTGKKVSFSINNSDFRTNYSYSYLDPYYTVDGVSRGFSAYFRETDYEEGNVADFSTDALGGNVTFGYPIAENQRISFSLGLDQTDITEGVQASPEVSGFLLEEGNKNLTFNAVFSWNESTLNRGLMPDRGYSQRASFEMALPGSDLTFYKLNYQGQIFYPLSDIWTLRLRTELGYGDAYGSTQALPFYEHYFAGGFGSVRGYEDNTLGPKAEPHTADLDDPQPFGGNVLVEGGAELIFPIPFVEDKRSFRTALFFDAGNVFDSRPDAYISNNDRLQTEEFDLDLGELRYSAGFSMTWISGFGPLTFSIAKPINSGDDDDTKSFQFSLGNTF